jgi:hypothetical protein
MLYSINFLGAFAAYWTIMLTGFGLKASGQALKLKLNWLSVRSGSGAASSKAM